MMRNLWILIVFVWLSSSALLLWRWPDERYLELVFFDVGQGDAALIKTPYGQRILIDGGPDKKILEELADHSSCWDRQIDLVVLTHQHEDHLAGLLDVFKRYQVKNVIYSSASGSAALSGAWFAALEAEGAQVSKGWRQERVVFGPGCHLDIINPRHFYRGRDLNEYSLVSRLDCGITALFTGDAGKATEEKLLALGTDLSADVLKVGHHGSLSASSDDFLSAVDPFLAVISAGKDNRYGLPAPEVVRRLSAKGVFVHRTDHEGSVRFRFGRDGKLLRP